MERDQQYLRSILTVWEDGLWPQGGGLGNPDIFASPRHQAIAEVLRCIPEADYQKLRARADSFSWFIPHPEVRGMVNRFHATVFPEEEAAPGLTEAPYLDVIFLAPGIDRSAWDIAVAIVAHEVAHLALDHKLRVRPDEYEKQEDEAFAKLCEWGFEVEARKHRAVCRWREAMEAGLVERLEKDLIRARASNEALSDEGDR